MTDNHQRTTRQRRQDGRPPESFKGVPDGDKGREGERTHGRKGGGAEGRQEGREERGTGMALRLESGGGDHGSRQGAEREQTDRGKKERYKYLRERREKKRR